MLSVSTRECLVRVPRAAIGIPAGREPGIEGQDVGAMLEAEVVGREQDLSGLWHTCLGSAGDGSGGAALDFFTTAVIVSIAPQVSRGSWWYSARVGARN